MSLYEYETALQLNLRHIDIPFYSLIMAAIIRADSNNIEVLKCAFPEIYDEVLLRYHGGLLDGEVSND